MQANCCGRGESTALAAGRSRQRARWGRFLPRMSGGCWEPLLGCSAAAGQTDGLAASCRGEGGEVQAAAQQRVCKRRRRIGGPARGTAGSSWLSGPRAPRRAPRLRQPCPWVPWFAHGDPNPEVPGGWGRKGAPLRCPASLQGLLPLPRLLCKLGFAHLSGAGELQGQS